MDKMLAGIKVEGFTNEKISLADYARHIQNLNNNTAKKAFIDKYFFDYTPFECNISLKYDVLTYASLYDNDLWKVDTHLKELLKMVNVLVYCSTIDIKIEDFTLQVTYEDENKTEQTGRIYDMEKLVELYDLMFITGGHSFSDKYSKLSIEVDKILNEIIKQELEVNNSVVNYLTQWVDMLNKNLPEKADMINTVQEVLSQLDGKTAVVNKVLKYLGLNSKSKSEAINPVKAEQAINNISSMINSSNVGKSKDSKTKAKSGELNG
jgi:hypothetical protein